MNNDADITEQDAEIIKRMAAAMARAEGFRPFDAGNRWTGDGEISASEAWMLYEKDARLQYFAHLEINRWAYDGNR